MSLLQLKRSDLMPLDNEVLSDITHFGGLTRYQIVRRYRNPLLAQERIAFLEDWCVIERFRETLQGAGAIYGITVRAAMSDLVDAPPRTIRPGQLAHDIALVDLHDYLNAAYPTGRCYPERKVSRQIELHVRYADAPDRGHPPDGVLIDRGTAYGIELEHSVKWVERYVHICDWYGRESRLNEVWWFTDRPAVTRAVTRATDKAGTRRDIDFKFLPLPAGVTVRPRAKP